MAYSLSSLINKCCAINNMGTLLIGMHEAIQVVYCHILVKNFHGMFVACLILTPLLKAGR